MEAAICPKVRVWMAAFGCAVSALLLISPAAKAGIVTDGVPTDGGCPAIADKPDAAPHVDYQGVKHITYCYGPIDIQPRPERHPTSNRRTMAPAVRTSGPRCPATSLASTPSSSTPTEPFPGSTSCTCTTPSGPSTAARSSPSGRRRRSSSYPRGSAGGAFPTDTWILNDMLHDLVAQPAKVYVVWRIDFVPDSSPAAASIKHGAHQVAGRRREPEHLSGLRRPASGRPQRHLHVPRSGAGRGSPSVRRWGR